MIEILTLDEIVLRLVAAALLGALLGLNRERRGKPAGLRTRVASLVHLGPMWAGYRSRTIYRSNIRSVNDHLADFVFFFTKSDVVAILGLSSSYVETPAAALSPRTREAMPR